MFKKESKENAGPGNETSPARDTAKAKPPERSKPVTGKAVSKTITVILKKDHVHRGKGFVVNDKIDVKPRQADWLKEQGVI